MSREAERQARLREALGERELDAALISDLANIRYLTGFVGSNALALVSADGATLLTDGRYAVSARKQAGDAEVVIGKRDLLDDAAGAVGALGAEPAVGVEAAHLTLDRHARLERALNGARLVPTTGLVEDLRIVKDDGEVELIAEAATIADRAIADVLERGLVGRREDEVALDLHAALVRHGASAPSFPIIVAAGPGGALPHAVPRPDPIPDDTLCVIDLGALHAGYCSDMTRTIVLGEPDERLQEAYTVCRDAQIAGIEAVGPGVAAADVDRASRTVIDAAGLGKAFVHGLGHGVGLDIHERPGVRREATDTLASGMVLTIEPGIYLEGLGGVRIEDLLVVTDQGARVLSRSPKDDIAKEHRTA